MLRISKLSSDSKSESLAISRNIGFSRPDEQKYIHCLKYFNLVRAVSMALNSADRLPILRIYSQIRFSTVKYFISLVFSFSSNDIRESKRKLILYLQYYKKICEPRKKGGKI